jgi:hypothetical protein
MDPVLSFEAAAGCISLADELVKLIQSIKKGGHKATLSEIRLQLPGLALSHVQRIKSQTQNLKSVFIQEGLVDLTIPQAIDRESFCTWLIRGSFNEYRAAMEGIKNSLQSMNDDLSAVLLCSHAWQSGNQCRHPMPNL